jgi:zinc transport system substrate-binding protein
VPKTVFRASLLLTASLVFSLPATAEVKVAVSIKPIHSIVSSVMKGVGIPKLIIDGANSPHTYVLKPTDAETLEQANLVIWVGETLEPALKKPVNTFAADAAVLTLLNTRDLKRWETREENIFGETHVEEAGEHADEDDHEDENSKVEGKSITAVKANNGVDSRNTDPHIWLNPDNAKTMAKTIAEVVSRLDPENAKTYMANVDALSKEIDGLTSEIEASLKDQKPNFVVFHDAYQYFEKKFGVKSGGVIAIHPENPPGAKAISEIRDLIKSKAVSCVYSEPQFDPKLVEVIMEGTAAKTGVLDPLGSTLEPGADLYFALLRNLANSIKTC